MLCVWAPTPKFGRLHTKDRRSTVNDHQLDLRSNIGPENGRFCLEIRSEDRDIFNPTLDRFPTRSAVQYKIAPLGVVSTGRHGLSVEPTQL